MIIKVTGKNETLKEIEEVKKLLDDAGKILYRLQTTIGLTVEENIGHVTEAANQTANDILMSVNRCIGGAPGPRNAIPCPKSGNAESLENLRCHAKQIVRDRDMENMGLSYSAADILACMVKDEIGNCERAAVSGPLKTQRGENDEG